MVGSTGTLGNISLNITYTETIDEAHVYISTATLNSAVEETSINCTDGNIPRSQTVQIRSEFSTTQCTHLYIIHVFIEVLMSFLIVIC